MDKHRFAALAIAALALAPLSALADPANPAVAPRPIGPCSGDYLAVSGLSDYRFDGFSESNRGPTWQATAYCYDKAGYFAGVTLTGVDFLDRPRTHFETDWYVGRQVRLGAYSLTATLLYAAFPDKRAPGPGYDIIEPEIEFSRTAGRLTLKGLGSWSTSATTRYWHFRAMAAYQVTPWLKLDADAGRYWAVRGYSYDAWDVGASATWRRFTLGAHYGGTDRRPSRCFFTDWCAPGPAVALAYRLLP